MVTLTTLPSDPLFNLPPYVGQRSATFRFYLIDGVTGQVLQELHPYRDAVPTLTHDTTRTIMRQVSNIEFDVADTTVLNTVRNRVRIYMEVAGRDPYPLGTFVFSDQARQLYTSGTESNVSLLDQMFIVDQQIEESISFHQTAIYPTAVNFVMRDLPFRVEQEPSNFNSIGSWSAGTNRGQVLNDLAVDGDYFAPWFDNNDILRFIRTFDPATAVPTFDFDDGYQVARSSIILSDDLLNAPNRFVVISNGQASDVQALTPVVGRYDIPSSAPHSIANRGFVIPEVVDRQVGDSTQAQAIARNLGQRQTIFETIELETSIDPRHDSYDVFQFNGERWLEIAWSIELIEGGRMTHTGRKAYS